MKFDIKQDLKIFKKLYKKIKLENIIHIMLLRNKLRKAYWVFPDPEYKVNGFTKDQFNKEIGIMMRYFDKNRIYNSNLGPGTIFSIVPIPENVEQLNDEQIGFILGYPCAEDFKYHIERHKYGEDYDMYSARLAIEFDNSYSEIITNVCRDYSLDKIRKIADKMTSYFNELNVELKKEYGKEINFVLTINKLITLKTIITRFKSKNIDQELADRIFNILANCGYGLLLALQNENKIDIFHDYFHDEILGVLKDCKDMLESNKFKIHEEINKETIQMLQDKKINITEEDINNSYAVLGRLKH